MSLVSDPYVDQVMAENSREAQAELQAREAAATTLKPPTFRELLPTIAAVIVGLFLLRWLWRATR